MDEVTFNFLWTWRYCDYCGKGMRVPVADAEVCPRCHLPYNNLELEG